MNDFSVTTPLSVDHEQVWVFINTDTELVAARVAINDITQMFCALPVDTFHTDTIVPAYRDTGEPCPTVRWATTTDVEPFADIFNEAH